MKMSEFAHKHDAYIAAEISRLGKTRDCRCWVQISSGEDRTGNPTGVQLVHKLTCPVHYPKTSALLVRAPKGGVHR